MSETATIQIDRHEATMLVLKLREDLGVLKENVNLDTYPLVVRNYMTDIHRLIRKIEETGLTD